MIPFFFFGPYTAIRARGIGTESQGPRIHALSRSRKGCFYPASACQDLRGEEFIIYIQWSAKSKLTFYKKQDITFDQKKTRERVRGEQLTVFEPSGQTHQWTPEFHVSLFSMCRRQYSFIALNLYSSKRTSTISRRCMIPLSGITSTMLRDTSRPPKRAISRC